MVVELTDDMIEQQMPMIRAIASFIRQSVPASIELDDLISEGIVGLYDAYENYDPARGVKFSTYARHRVRGAMLDSLRLEYRQSGRHSELTDDIQQSAPNLDDSIAARQSIDLLPSQERCVVVQRFYGGCQQREIGKRMRVSKQRVSLIESSALGRMRRVFKIKS